MAQGIFGYTCLGISVTLTCPLECAHCITNSSPRIREEMTLEEALGYVRDARGAVDHISVTGGEPFLKPQRLEGIVREAKAGGYIVSVMTSGFWGSDKASTYQKLSKLKDLGLDMVGVSLDRFHLEFIEESCCINIAEAADQLDIPVAVRVITTKGDDYGNHVRQILGHTRAEVHVNYMVRLGRACGLSDDAFNSCPHPPSETCETVTAADVVPGGNVYACCGPGLYMTETNPLLLGNARTESLRVILERGLNNPFMKVINTRGPIGLMQDLADHGFGDLLKIRHNYTDACQLCLDICNNPRLVQTLTQIYSRIDVQRTQNANQFLKMVGEFKAIEQSRSQTQPARWVRNISRPGI